jgi:hypothetical protein
MEPRGGRAARAIAVNAEHVLSGPHIEGKALGETSGVCSRLSRSGMAPPMWYGKPQFANET